MKPTGVQKDLLTVQGNKAIQVSGIVKARLSEEIITNMASVSR